MSTNYITFPEGGDIATSGSIKDPILALVTASSDVNGDKTPSGWLRWPHLDTRGADSNTLGPQTKWISTKTIINTSQKLDETDWVNVKSATERMRLPVTATMKTGDVLRVWWNHSWDKAGINSDVQPREVVYYRIAINTGSIGFNGPFYGPIMGSSIATRDYDNPDGTREIWSYERNGGHWTFINDTGSDFNLATIDLEVKIPRDAAYGSPYITGSESILTAHLIGT